MHCVDLGESFQTHIYLQHLASIQPRTSPLKFARSSGAADLGLQDVLRVLEELVEVGPEVRLAADEARDARLDGVVPKLLRDGRLFSV